MKAAKNKWTSEYMNFAHYPRGITREESTAVRLYTTPFYKIINKHFRKFDFDQADLDGIQKTYTSNFSHLHGYKDFTKKTKNRIFGKSKKTYDSMGAFDEIVAYLEAGRLKHHQPPRDLVVRGIDLDRPEMSTLSQQLRQPGSIISDPAYMSTSIGRPFLKKDIVIMSLDQKKNGWSIYCAELRTPSRRRGAFWPRNAIFC